MALMLHWRATTTLPVDAGWISPDRLRGLTHDQIAHQPIPVGNATRPLSDLFTIEGETSSGELVVSGGDLGHLHGLAAGMGEGQLVVEGTVGSRLAVGMSGGRVEVHGDAGDWAFAEMKGGQGWIRGNAGDHLGSALPGSRVGMRGGVILVSGSVGASCGLAMRRGFVAVGGDCGPGLGRGLVAGTCFVFGRLGCRSGLGMKRGSIVAFGERPELSATFSASGAGRPTFLTIYLKQLMDWGFSVPDHVFSGVVDRYNGDLSCQGQGELLVWKP